MVLVEKKSDTESSKLVLYSYDVAKGEKVKIKEYYNCILKELFL